MRCFTTYVLTFFYIFSQAQYFERKLDIPVSISGNQLLNPWMGGLTSAQVSTIDLNLDGLDDLYVFDRSVHKSFTFINDGVDYNYDPTYEEKFPELFSWVLLRDYNCDGKKDIFSYATGGIQVWENTSNSTDGVQFVQVSTLIYSKQGANLLNLYVSSVDIPSIEDVDGDGDLDVLTFGILGGYMEYHKNLSKENYGDCNTLEFELYNSCWGHFSETGTGTNEVTLNDVCAGNVTNPELYVPDPNSEMIKKHGAHSGSTVLAIDIDGNGVKDLLLGDVSFNNVVMLLNDDIGVNANSSMVSQVVNFPDYDTPIDVSIFPAIFYEDVDNDGKKDLLVSPNYANQGEDKESIYFYKNTSANSTPVFQYVESNFLQNQQIEVGSAAYPVPFDYNNDGLMDLIIANFGSYDKTSGTYKSNFTLLENTGTVSAPEFTLVDVNYLDIQGKGYKESIYPTFGDIDGDGDKDMVIGDYEGVLHLYENIGGSGLANFVLKQSPLKDNSAADIDVGIAAMPVLFDLDNDDDLDLIIGERNGNLNYYENSGNANAFSFKFKTDTLGKVKVNLDGYPIGFSKPYFIKSSLGETQMLVGSDEGVVHYYSDIDGNLNGKFREVEYSIDNINIGSNSSPALYDFDNDGMLDMILGNQRGGVAYYKGKKELLSSIDYKPIEFSIYPNPSNGDFSIITSENSIVNIYSIHGALAYSSKLMRGVNTKNISLQKGIYMLEISDSKGYKAYQKLVIN